MSATARIAYDDHGPAGRLVENVETVIYGKREAVRLAVVGLLSEGHVLLEDVPGTGKTTLARALALSINAEFKRVQLTSDLLPADVLGFTYYSQEKDEVRFRHGPVFTNVLLADELNRTTPRTQSSLLECMSERQVSFEGQTRSLPRPFFVIATQNPVEFEGTYPLPESQLDRFLLRIELGYPEREAESDILRRKALGDPLDELEPVMSIEEVRGLIEDVRRVRVADPIYEYVLDVCEATRRSELLHLGVSPRASQGLLRAARALALLEGREYVVPDDVKTLCRPVLAHRVIPSQLDNQQDASSGDILEGILNSVTVPH